MNKMRKCEKRFYVRFYSLWTAKFNFCLSCDPFLGSVMSFILPVSIGVGDGGTYPQEFVKKNIFCGQLLRTIRAIFRQKRVRFRNIVTLSSGK